MEGSMQISLRCQSIGSEWIIRSKLIVKVKLYFDIGVEETSVCSMVETWQLFPIDLFISELHTYIIYGYN